MHFSKPLPLPLHLAAALIITTASACTQCPHPGTFVGFVTAYTSPNPNYCETPVTSKAFAVSVPAKYYDPFDESPCDGFVNVTNPCTGKTISAQVVGNCTACANNDLLLTTAGLAALANGGKVAPPSVVVWTFA